MKEQLNNSHHNPERDRQRRKQLRRVWAFVGAGLICALVGLVLFLALNENFSAEKAWDSATDSFCRMVRYEPIGLLTVDPADSSEYRNRERISNIGDPYILELEGRYYLTATGEGRGFDLYSSSDLNSWQKEGQIFATSPTEGWVRSSLWQPQIVIGDDGYFYLYYCGNNDAGSLRIGVARSKRITGPYENVTDSPLLELGYATIDPFYFCDEDGSRYLFYSRDCSENILGKYHTSELYGIEMQDYTHPKPGAHPVRLLSPDQDWELVNGDYRWNEGPHVLKRDDRYYLFYSGGCYADKSYGIGYAVSDFPLGPYTKYEHNPILASTEEVSGPGNNSFCASPDGEELYNIYHSHTIPMIGGGNRKVNLDRCGFRADGSFFANGPTTEPQTPISGLGGLSKVSRVEAIRELPEKQSRSGGMHMPESRQSDENRLAALVDGETLLSRNEACYEWFCERALDEQTTENSGKNELFRFLQRSEKRCGFEVTLEKKTALTAIYLYGTMREEYSPKILRIETDGGYIEAVGIPAGQKSPVVLRFDPVETRKVRVLVDDWGDARGFALSEIMMYEKKG